MIDQFKNMYEIKTTHYVLTQKDKVEMARIYAKAKAYTKQSEPNSLQKWHETIWTMNIDVSKIKCIIKVFEIYKEDTDIEKAEVKMVYPYNTKYLFSVDKIDKVDKELFNYIERLFFNSDGDSYENEEVNNNEG